MIHNLRAAKVKRVTPSANQKQTIAFAGLTLIAAQHCERFLGGCLTYLLSKGVSEEAWRTMDGRHRKLTLERLERRLSDYVDVPTELSQGIQSFIESRNRFVHRLFSEDAFKLTSDTACANANTFMIGFLTEAAVLRDIFASALSTAMSRDGLTLPIDLVELTNEPFPFRDIFNDAPKQPIKHRRRKG